MKESNDSHIVRSSEPNWRMISVSGWCNQSCTSGSMISKKVQGLTI